MAALTASAQTAPKRHGWEENFSLYGDVESITIISYHISNGIAAEKAYSRKTYRFNDNGHVSEILYNDTPTVNYTYKFDKRGNVTQSRRENHDNGEVYATDCYRYNSKGQLVEVTGEGKEYDDVWGSWKTIYKYNTKGNTIKVKELYVDDGRKFITTYKYDKYQKVIKIVAIDTGINDNRMSTYTYDDKGNKIEERYYDFETPTGKTIYKYDDKGNKVEECTYDVEGSLINKYTYKYDDKGNKVEECRYDMEGSLIDKYTYKYNNSGQVVEEAYYYGESLREMLTYKYDSKGNLTEEISLKGEKITPVEQTIYEITYRR
jgi:hypothetical protein